MFIDFSFNEANFEARLKILELTPQPTNWTGHVGVNVPEKDVTLQKLGPNEIEAKIGATAAATGQRMARAGDRDNAKQPAGGTQ